MAIYSTLSLWPAPDHAFDFFVAIAGAETFQSLIREYCSIENGWHWVLDTLYLGDLSQVRAKKAVRNFAVLRRMPHNILTSDETVRKSLPMKQMRAMADDDYRNNLLSLAG